MAWTEPPRTWITDETASAATYNQHVRDQLVYLKQHVDALEVLADAAVVFNSGAILAPDGVTTVLTFDSEVFDTNTLHDVASNTSKLTCKTAGKYLIVGSIEWSANATNSRLLNIRKNGTINLGSHRMIAIASATIPQLVVALRDLAVNDYVELTANQNSGAGLNILASSAYSPYFGMLRLSA